MGGAYGGAYGGGYGSYSSRECVLFGDLAFPRSGSGLVLGLEVGSGCTGTGSR
jgi:hypothetical protein